MRIYRNINLAQGLMLLSIIVGTTMYFGDTSEISRTPQLISVLLLLSSILVSVIFSSSLLQKEINFGWNISSRLAFFSPLFMILTFFYGAILGLINGADSISKMSTHFGLLLYLVYYALIWIKPDRGVIILLVTIGAVLNVVFPILDSEAKIFKLISYGVGIDPIEDLRTIYSFGFFSTLPLLFVIGAIANKFLQRSLLFFLMMTFLYLCLAILIYALTISKGFLIAIFFSMAVVGLNSYIASTFKYRLILIFVGVLLLFTLYLSDFFGDILQSFTSSSIGNAERSDQLRFLISEISFLGVGFGIPLQSGYRREPSGLVFELTFIDLIFKVGVVSILPVLVYVFSLLVALSKGLNSRSPVVPFFSLGCFSFLFPAIGNPVAFAFPVVFLHCIGLYVLFEPEQSKLLSKSWSS